MKNTSKLCFLFLLSFISIKSLCQEDNKTDTLYIFFDRPTGGIQTIRKAKYFKPELKYPLDISRHYFINAEEFIRPETDKNGRFVWMKYMFMSYPDLSKDPNDFYFLEDRKKFLSRDYLDQEWFDMHKFADVVEYFDNKILMIVNPRFLYNNQYYVVRVYFDDNIIE